MQLGVEGRLVYSVPRLVCIGDTWHILLCIHLPLLSLNGLYRHVMGGAVMVSKAMTTYVFFHCVNFGIAIIYTVATELNP